jgi:murein DD-endopeptidase MepM/ murein hydrolase activator NlpD
VPTFAWPIEAYASRHGAYGPRYLSSDFGSRAKPCAACSSYHEGIDIGVDVGTNVMATADGTVRQIVENNSTAGTYVTVEHADGYWSRYLHLSRYDVSVGDAVRQGQILGVSGGQAGAWGAGSSQAPHLHFEIWQGEPKRGGTALDPETLLTKEVKALTKQQAASFLGRLSAGGSTERTMLIVTTLSAAAAAIGIFYTLRATGKVTPRLEAPAAVPALPVAANPKRRRARRRR